MGKISIQWVFRDRQPVFASTYRVFWDVSQQRAVMEFNEYQTKEVLAPVDVDNYLHRSRTASPTPVLSTNVSFDLEDILSDVSSCNFPISLFTYTCFSTIVRRVCTSATALSILSRFRKGLVSQIVLKVYPSWIDTMGLEVNPDCCLFWHAEVITKALPSIYSYINN